MRRYGLHAPATCLGLETFQTNWPSILAKGLQIAPPEAPSSGYMFDKGIYFADMVRHRQMVCPTQWS